MAQSGNVSAVAHAQSAQRLIPWHRARASCPGCRQHCISIESILCRRCRASALILRSLQAWLGAGSARLQL
jgi:hypothetical protein